jgi:hypothetical protein
MKLSMNLCRVTAAGESYTERRAEVTRKVNGERQRRKITQFDTSLARSESSPTSISFTYSLRASRIFEGDLRGEIRVKRASFEMRKKE